MTQQEHLQLIRTKCVELLELAKQRTPGRWKTSRVFGDWGFAHVDQIVNDSHRPEHDGNGITLNYGGAIQCVGPRDKRNTQSSNDAAFIASAAGPFEAALASTVVSIDTLSKIAEERESVEHGYSSHLDGPYTSRMRTGAARFAEEKLQEIITSWPLELLQP